MKRLAFATTLLLCACGSSSSGTTGTRTTGSGTTSSGMMGANVPDPGSSANVDQNFGSTEPNDTPATATPLGIAKGPDVYVWVNSNSAGGADLADYFVFK